MEMKCPNCGAGIDSDGKFCKYCGAKLPDNTQKIEINQTVNHNVNWVNKAKIARIEKQAEMKKMELENLGEVKKQERKDATFGFIGGIILLIVLVLLIRLISK